MKYRYTSVMTARPLLEAFERIHAILIKHVPSTTLVGSGCAHVAVASPSAVAERRRRSEGRRWDIEDAVSYVRVHKGFHANRTCTDRLEEVGSVGTGD